MYLNRLLAVLKDSYQRFVSQTESAAIFGIYRILFSFYVAFVVIDSRPHILRTLKKGICQNVDLLTVLPTIHLSEIQMGLLISCLVSALVAAGVGIFTRFSLVVALLLFVLVQGYAIGCTMGGHSYRPWEGSIVVWNLIVLIAAPQVEFLGFAWAVRGWRSGNFRLNEVTACWPRKLLEFLLFYAYFASSIAKLRLGLDWMNGYTLQYLLLARYFEKAAEPSLWLANNFNLLVPLSIATVAIEFSVLLLLFYPKLKVFYIVAFSLFNLSCWYVMNLDFFKLFIAGYAIYVAMFLHRYIIPWLAKTVLPKGVYRCNDGTGSHRRQ
jgi:hypothetical protein